MVRWMTTHMLEGMGYTVIQSETPEEAVSICGREEPAIDLILSDVIMPGMNGREVTDKARELRPGIKVLYMSGYTADIVAERGMVEDGMHFIQKPFSLDALCDKVKEALQDSD
jgi:CheY-like chemotaxis protein